MDQSLRFPSRIIAASRMVASLTKSPQAKALGHICLLLSWMFERENAAFSSPDSCRIIEGASQWDGEPGALARAFVDSEIVVPRQGGTATVSAAYLPSLVSQRPDPYEIRVRLKTPEEREAHMKEQAAAFRQQRLERESRVTAKGHVYFIQQGDGGSIKIGYSKNPAQRLASLQTGHSESLHMRAIAPGSMAQERALHDRFSHLRVSGEWFRPDEDLVAYMRLVSDRRAL